MQYASCTQFSIYIQRSNRSCESSLNWHISQDNNLWRLLFFLLNRTYFSSSAQMIEKAFVPTLSTLIHFYTIFFLTDPGFV